MNNETYNKNFNQLVQQDLYAFMDKLRETLLENDASLLREQYYLLGLPVDIKNAYEIQVIPYVPHSIVINFKNNGVCFRTCIDVADLPLYNLLKDTVLSSYLGEDSKEYRIFSF